MCCTYKQLFLTITIITMSCNLPPTLLLPYRVDVLDSHFVTTRSQNSFTRLFLSTILRMLLIITLFFNDTSTISFVCKTDNFTAPYLPSFTAQLPTNKMAVFNQRLPMWGILKCWRDARTEWAATMVHTTVPGRHISNTLVYVLVHINFSFEYSVQGIVIIWILRSIDFK